VAGTRYDIVRDTITRLTPARLRQLRVARGHTQRFVCAACGFDPRNFQRWESGAKLPTLPSLVTLAAFYDVPITTLLPDPESYADPEVAHAETA
jgi:transcriptional regulator with XRE-family HTH domain